MAIDGNHLILGRPVFAEDEAVLVELATASELVEDRIVVALWHAVPTSQAAVRWVEFAAAVAALDMHVAGALLRLTIGRDEWQTLVESSSPDPDWLATLIAQAEEELSEGDTDLAELIDAADAALGFIVAGGQDNPPAELRKLVDETIKELVSTARDPVVRFVRVLPNAISPAIVHRAFDIVTAHPFADAPLTLYASGPYSAAGRFVKTGLRKLMAATGIHTEQLSEWAAGLFGSRLVERLAQLQTTGVDAAIGAIVRRHTCEERVGSAIDGAGAGLLEDAYADLSLAFTPLKLGYRAQQKHAPRVAKAVGVLAPLVTAVGPLAGPAAVVGIVVIGVAYPLIGLADRLDTSSFVLLNRVDGVCNLVERHLTPPDGNTDETT